VERSDGAVAIVEARTPKAVQAVQLEPEITYSGPNTALAAKVVLPVYVDGSAPRVLNVQAEYTLLTDVVSVPPSGFENVYHRISIPYMSHVKEEGGNWRVDIDLRRDYVTMRDSLTELHVWRPSFGAYVALLTLRMDVVNEEWNPPGGAFDPEILVQPGSFSNVVNGFGFVGAGFQLRHTLLVNDEWDPLEQEAERAAGFNPCPC
jgi:hypothetical protein